MSDQNTQRCGFEAEYCSDCQRPAEMKPVCQAYHRLMHEARTLVNSKPTDNVLHASLVELLTIQAVDLLLERTKRPDRTIDILRKLIIDRMEELKERGLLVEVKLDPPVGNGYAVH